MRRIPTTMLRFAFALTACCSVLSLRAQPVDNPPKLIVGLVVDQMRYDFLTRYWDNFGEGGFRRLVEEGYSFSYAHYPYVPTYTGPGHASIYTGGTPAVHGIVGNDWFDRRLGKRVYCVNDTTVTGVGARGYVGEMSPRNLMTSTITDELRLSTNLRGKVVSVCLKDRGSILPAGHFPNGAYWFDSETGHFITSSYYGQASLPKWLQAFNKRGVADSLLRQQWSLLLPADQYRQSTADNMPFEKPLPGGEKSPVFPHNLPILKKEAGLELVKYTPFGNYLTLSAASAAVEGESLGRDADTDFLCVSLSSPDYIGHNFGPNSLEIEDTYVRLDRQLATFFNYLDNTVGKGNYLLFLTADHGVSPAPGYAKQLGMPGGSLIQKPLAEGLDEYLYKQFGQKDLVRYLINQQVYLDRELIVKRLFAIEEVLDACEFYLLTQPGVVAVIPFHRPAFYRQLLMELVSESYYPPRSGDLYVQMEPNWVEEHPMGSSHGTAYRYDTHVPLLWMGWRVQPGRTQQYVKITQIAPTIAQLIGILEPSGCVDGPMVVPVK